MAKLSIGKKSRSSSSNSSIDWGEPPDLSDREGYVRKGREFVPSGSLMWASYKRICGSLGFPPVGKKYWPFIEGLNQVRIKMSQDDQRYLCSSILLSEISKGKAEPKFIFSYELIDVFLGNSENASSVSYYHSVSCLVMIVGEGEARNRYLPQLVFACLEARKIRALPTLLVSSKSFEVLGRKWDTWSDSSEASMEAYLNNVRVVGGA